jgi:hypothetical protein
MRSKVHLYFEKYPRFASGVTGFCTFSVGDLFAQRLQMNTVTTTATTSTSVATTTTTTATQDTDHLKFDYRHPVEIGVLGFFSNGYILTHWYHMLEKVFGTSMICKRVVFTKVFADQLIYAPFCIVLFFAYSSWLSEGTPAKSWNEFVLKCKDSFTATFLADCSVWPVANFINFRVVPLVYRAPFTAFVQLLWQSYMSFVTSARHISNTEFQSEEEE